MTLSNEILLASAEYSFKNSLFGGFLVLAFLFWIWVYIKSPKIELSKDNMVYSMTSLSIKIVCWSWFISLFYLLKVIMFVSRSPTFLEDKLLIINGMYIITGLILGIILVLNALKYLYQLGNIKEALKEMVYDVRGYNRK